VNKTKYLIIALVSVFSLVLWGGRSFSQEWAEGTVQSYYQSKGWDGFEGGWLIGHRVYSPVGGDLGQICDLMIDRSDGHIALVILSDVPGFGSEFVAAPFGALERTGDNVFQLNFGDRDIPVASTYEDQYAYELARYRSTVGFSTIPSSIDPLWADTLYRFYGQTPYWTEGKTPHQDIMSYRTAHFSITESFFMGTTAPVLMGATVQSQDGTAVARIDDLVIDSKDGRVALLVLDQVPGRADAQVAVPFADLSLSGNAFAFNFTEDRLADAPSFDEFADANNPQKAEDIYRYFGEQPYWTEGGNMSAPMMEHSISGSSMEEGGGEGGSSTMEQSTPDY
jgi:sporulation protein YlmC with PRC-barrel domain